MYEVPYHVTNLSDGGMPSKKMSVFDDFAIWFEMTMGCNDKFGVFAIL